MSSSGVVVCPELEELAIRHWRTFDTKDVAGTLAARALRGTKLKTVRIIGWGGSSYPQLDLSELKKYAVHVKSRCNWH